MADPVAASGIAVSRAFVALWPAAHAAAHLQRTARECCPDTAARPVPAKDLHCTLAYLGDLAVPDLARLADALDAVSGAPFTLTFDTIEFWSGPSVLVACARQVPEALTMLQRAVTMAVVAAGLPAETRPYRPHVTVRRQQRRDCAASSMAPCASSFSAFVLAGSNGPSTADRYRLVRRWELAGREA